MSLARFVADQRTMYRVPHAVCCRVVGVSQAWLYKWLDRARPGLLESVEEPVLEPVEEPVEEPVLEPVLEPVVQSEGPVRRSVLGPVLGPVPVASFTGPAGWGFVTARDRRRAWLDAQVRVSFELSKGSYGSPRVWEDLVEAGWVVSVNTVADSMRRQGLVGRKKKHRRGLTRPDKAAVPFPDLLRRDFTAQRVNQKWVGDITEIPTLCGSKLYLATVIDLFARRLLGAATGTSPNADLCKAAIKIAVAARGGKDQIEGVIFHSDRGSTYTDQTFSKLCTDLGVTQSMGRVGSCFDNAAAELFFSTFEWEVLSRHEFATPVDAKPVVGEWCYDFYNTRRRHSSAGMLTPAAYEQAHANVPSEPADLAPEAA